MTRYQDMNDFMADCGIKIRHAARDSVIRERFRPFGYDEQRHESHIALYNETVGIISRHAKELTDWQAACNAYHNSLHEAKKQFTLLKQTLKFWYPASSSEAVALDLYNDRITTYRAFMDSAGRFYNNLIKMQEVSEKLTPFGYVRELIKKQKTNLEQLELLRENRNHEHDHMPVPAHECNRRVDELAEIANEIAWLARLLFQDDEAHFLQKLGVIDCRS
ncbi:MAG: hypothetical protein AB7V25_06575 [Mangrovibacterium sp.]